MSPRLAMPTYSSSLRRKPAGRCDYILRLIKRRWSRWLVACCRRSFNVQVRPRSTWINMRLACIILAMPAQKLWSKRDSNLEETGWQLRLLSPGQKGQKVGKSGNTTIQEQLPQGQAMALV